MIPIVDKGESRELFEWVKASDTPDEYDTYTTMIEQRGGGKVSQKPAFSQWNGQWRTEEDWKVYEWLKPIPQSSLKEGKELLLCPFCGKEPEWVNLKHPSGIPALKCFECQFEMQQDRRDKTIFYWNRRSSSLTPKSIRDSDAELLGEIRQIKAVIIHFATLDKMPTLQLLNREGVIDHIVTRAQKILSAYPPKKQL